MRGIWAIFGTILIAFAAHILAAGSSQCDQDTSTTTDTSLLEQQLRDAKAKAIASKGNGVPALWKLSDNDTEIYLFGTVHNLPEETVWINDTISQALNQADEIFLEVELTSAAARKVIDSYQQEHGFLPPGQSLFEQMDVGDAYRLKQGLKAFGENPQQFDHLQPWLAAIQISQVRMKNSGFKTSSGVESYLEAFASKNKKKMRYLETIEDQMTIWDSGNFDDQISNLAAMSWTLSDPITELDLVTQEWLDGDIYGVGLLVSNPELEYSKKNYDQLIKQRNQAWTPQILARLEQAGVTFIAIGAAHLAGPDSVIKLIEQNSKTVERIQ